MPRRATRSAAAPPRPAPFVQPASLDEAERRRGGAVERVTELQREASDRDKRGPDGRRLPHRAWSAWRKGVLERLTAAEVELRRLNGWIKSHGRPLEIAVGGSLAFDERDPESMIAAAHHLFVRLSARGVRFLGDEEQQLVEAFGRRVRARSAS